MQGTERRGDRWEVGGIAKVQARVRGRLERAAENEREMPASSGIFCRSGT